MLDGLTGEPTFIEAMANAPELLNFAMVEFYQKIFFGGRVEQKYKQLVRLRLSLAHGCRSCNLQNRAGIRAAGYDDATSPRSRAIARSSTPAERAVLDFADEMVLTNPGGRLDRDALRSPARAFRRCADLRARRGRRVHRRDGENGIRARPGREGADLPVRSAPSPPSARRTPARRCRACGNRGHSPN